MNTLNLEVGRRIQGGWSRNQKLSATCKAFGKSGRIEKRAEENQGQAPGITLQGSLRPMQ
jgi:hypothetical protein